ncbi:UDP-N-acetylenolpyruvoylglucosamine reductase,UDP-N-acetylenolpyruvoylglucosamine reductase,UDP-N-acetylmuramate dehydrogenase,UDP-N-acetylenolpyruvoylglucosamine reductase,UDP-N-acetylenolpyruvoylglucosamine reductase, C-terminal domain [Chlamydia serpentis]|uniref:UDP-N-acetylenolpyruvoylglucosamine reductase n=1 Tax=Chlamydia serpentis TaxID=1967782 RepID=A0A2R8FCE4_9CHLA|nr:UDP-N-acetylmuramate dehydrogenase [Chlamydia serpentis]SPN74093.1 UDP-N-acetylenolpyruvoylglucosamine reductase,UDP-N-acetylenolpyruvoylglucosamine reductase,UDP-N-acetylmuramate dehydrogenase,UDP-N-acetylenolpyruvoylglucosamine reductase,UDP-N-acetylenolpyruvoylglucosamine reductase, C-terminal domain [Chlamydia serpentis]
MQESGFIHFPFPVRRSVWLNRYSTFRIGGPANYFKAVHTIDEAREVIRFLHSINYPFLILGKGSNCLFDDRGFDGFVLYNAIYGKKFLEDACIKAYSGLSFSALGKTTAYEGYSGLEFAAGIPGSVGGAIFMNAGTNEVNISSVVKNVETINSEGKLCSYSVEELELSYRSSRFHRQQEFILSATFQLSKKQASAYYAKQLLQQRLLTQPYTQPSAGCIFRNPEGISAGRLIDEAGLKGLVIGGAQISPMHGNFIVNTGKATSDEVKQLIEIIKSTLKTRGIDLEHEIRIIPYQPIAQSPVVEK